MTATKYRLYETLPPPSLSTNDHIHFFEGAQYRDRLFLLNTGELVYANYASYRSNHTGKDKFKLGIGAVHDELVIYKQFDYLEDLFSFTTKEQLIARKHILLKRRDRPLYEGSSSYYYDYIDVGRLFWDDEGIYIWS